MKSFYRLMGISFDEPRNLVYFSNQHRRGKIVPKIENAQIYKSEAAASRGWLSTQKERFFDYLWKVVKVDE